MQESKWHWEAHFNIDSNVVIAGVLFLYYLNKKRTST
ncbi:hypothetical protein J9874_03688 (plasmid) [Duffyella gerundensis]|nr:hypothetical protein J9874_03688 [Duffyella gerundensis]